METNKCSFAPLIRPASIQRQEVEQVSGGRSLTYDQLAQLTYLDAVLREALRLHPSVPLDSKFATESLTWLGDDEWKQPGG